MDPGLYRPLPLLSPMIKHRNCTWRDSTLWRPSSYQLLCFIRRMLFFFKKKNTLFSAQVCLEPKEKPLGERVGPDCQDRKKGWLAPSPACQQRWSLKVFKHGGKRSLISDAVWAPKRQISCPVSLWCPWSPVRPKESGLIFTIAVSKVSACD